MKVRVVATVDVDTDQWATDNGVEHTDEIRAQVHQEVFLILHMLMDRQAAVRGVVCR